MSAINSIFIHNTLFNENIKNLNDLHRLKCINNKKIKYWLTVINMFSKKYWQKILASRCFLLN